MLRIVGCITQQHDLWLVALAACICVLACGTTVNLLAGVRTQKRHLPLAHLATASVVFGCGVWSLHFVAMLAFASPVPIAYGIAVTFGSVLVAIVGTLSALLIWQFSRSGLARVVIGGGLLGSSISAMHFSGILAMQVTGTVHMASSEAELSVVLAIALSIVALARFEGLPSNWRRIETTAWLTVAICGLHFTAMTGLSLEPGLARNSQAAILGSGGLAVAIGSFSVAILIVCLAATIMEQHLAQRAALELQRMQMLGDLSQEILIICRNGIILKVNVAGVRTFGARHLPGSRILDLVLDADRPIVARLMADSGIDPGHQEVHLCAENSIVLTAEISCRIISFEGAPAIVVAFRDLTDRKRDEARIRHLAHHDALTDMPNRFLLQERLTHALGAAKRSMTHIAVLYLDLDRFKPVNDLFGHSAGDALLVEVARRLQAEIRSSDTLARVGGDEFVIVAEYDQPENLAVLAGRLVDVTRNPFMLEVGQVEIGASVGIACYPGDAADQEGLLRAADVALYRAKQDGRNTFCFFEASMDEHLRARQRLEHDLRRAISNGELLLHYQPLVGSRTGEVEGFEALLRWRHPERGMIPPLDFIPLAEDTGLIVQIGQWVLETACEAAVGWKEPHWVAVNVSPAQFHKTNLPKMVSDTLARTGLSADRLEIEITEGILMTEPGKAAEVLSALRKLGVRIAMDDFGTGYSSLSYLHQFKFDKLKIDRSFVARLGSGDDATIIIRTIIGLAHNLGLSIVAEGVETVDQLNALRGLMCDQIQGYLIGRPMPMDGSTEFISARARMLVEANPIGKGPAELDEHLQTSVTQRYL